MQVCGFVVVFYNSLYPLFVFMHASLDLVHVLVHVSLSLYLQDRMLQFKKGFFKVKKKALLHFFGLCFFNALVQILKASIIRW